ncbi:MAG: NAD(P)H-hydrate epimerase [Thermoleophilia bacterium]|nr:NAD(P)H-hydrate epimerase [Thermoleophilia bacterium]
MLAIVSLPSAPPDSVTWISVAQMRDVDRVAMETGLSLVRMMENAGASLAAMARELLGGDLTGRRVAVLSGPGGNGGGGLVCARRLAGSGAEVEVRLSTEPEVLSEVSREQYQLLLELGIPVRVGGEDLADPELFVDALLGYGQRGVPGDRIAGLIERTRDGRVLALDVPSGLELESGTAYEPGVGAEATMTLALPKRGLASDQARERVGDLYLADIAIGTSVYDRLGIRYSPPFGPGPLLRLETKPHVSGA